MNYSIKLIFIGLVFLAPIQVYSQSLPTFIVENSSSKNADVKVYDEVDRSNPVIRSRKIVINFDLFLKSDSLTKGQYYNLKKNNVFNDFSTFKLHRLFKLKLFEDIVKIIQLNRVEKIHPNGEILTYTGKIKDDPFSEVTISVSSDNVMNANIIDGKGNFFKISLYKNEIHKIEEIDSSQFPNEGSMNFDKDFLNSNRLKKDSNIKNKIEYDDSIDGSHSFWDILVIYTAAAETSEGSNSAMETLIATAISETNTGYINSDIDARVFLVGTYRTSYTEDNSTGEIASKALSHIGSDSTISGVKSDYAADATILIYAETGSNLCGLGNLMQTTSGAFTTGNSVCRTSCCTGYYSFGHELGHNIGLCHDAPITSNQGDCLYDYSHGYGHSSGFRTVMAYSASCGGGSCTRVNYYSNPNISYNGVPTGTESMNNSAKHANQQAVFYKVANGKSATSANKGFRPAPLILPSHKATLTTTQIEFSWNDAHTPESSSVKYDFYLCNDENFSTSKCNTQFDSISSLEPFSSGNLILYSGSSLFFLGFIGFVKNKKRKFSSTVMIISLSLIFYSCENYTIKEGDADGGLYFISAFGDGGYKDNVTSKKITVDGIGSGTHYWKVITTDNDNSSNTATSYLRKFTIK